MIKFLLTASTLISLLPSQNQKIEKFKLFMEDTGRLHLYSKIKAYNFNLSFNKSNSFSFNNFIKLDTIDLELSKSALIDFAPRSRNPLAPQTKFVGINLLSILKLLLTEAGIWPGNLSELEKDAIWRKEIEELVSKGKL